MPLRWEIDSTKRIVNATADGLVGRYEVEALLDAMASAGAMPYRKLFDGRFGDTAMGAADLIALGARMRSFHMQPVGPLAVVVPPDKFELIARVLGVLAAAKRPMRMFTELRPARRWIDGFDPSWTPSGDAAPFTGRRTRPT